MKLSHLWTSLSRRCLSTELKLTKSLSEMPGPRSLPLIGSNYLFYPLIGKHSYSRLDLFGEDLLRKYGDIVRVDDASGNTLVHLFTPEDFQEVYEATFQMPSRILATSIAHYRKSRPHLYGDVGILSELGEEWWKLRKEYQRPLSPLKEVRKALPLADQITKEFVAKHLQPGTVIDDIESLLRRLFTEINWYDLLGERLGSFDEEGMKKGSRASALIDSVTNVNDVFVLVDNTNYQRSFPKPIQYKFLEKHMQRLEQIALETIERVQKRRDLEGDESMLAQYLKNPDIDKKSILSNFIDILLGGVDSTSAQVGFLLYLAGKEEAVRSRLGQEAQRLLPSERSPVTAEVLAEAQFSRAVLKETLRLRPITLGTTRILNSDVVLSGFTVPKNTTVMLQSMVATKRERYFEEPLQFLPERWFKESPFYRPVHPYLMTPFGAGLRSCLARRRAEQNIFVFLLNVFRQSQLQYLGEELTVTSQSIITKTSKPVRVLVSKQ